MILFYLLPPFYLLLTLFVSAAATNTALTFTLSDSIAAPITPFNATNPSLPKTSFTVQWTSNLHTRRLPTAYSVLALNFNNAFSPFAMPDGTVNFELDGSSAIFNYNLLTPEHLTGWKTFTFSYDATTELFRAYLNGNFEFEKEFKVSNYDAENPALFGHTVPTWHVGAAVFYDAATLLLSPSQAALAKTMVGSIDDLIIWNTALPASRVSSTLGYVGNITHPGTLKARITAGLEDDIALYYDFEEGSGVTAKNHGHAGAEYDIELGRTAMGETGYPAAKEGAQQGCHATESTIPFTVPVWSLRDDGDYVPAPSDLTAFSTTVNVVEGLGKSLFLGGSSTFGSQVVPKIVMKPDHGTLALIEAEGAWGTNNWYYVPDKNAGVSKDSASFAVTYQGVESEAALIYFEIMAIDDVPEFSAARQKNLTEGVSYSLAPFLGSLMDADSDEIMSIITEMPRHGTLSYVHADGSTSSVDEAFNIYTGGSIKTDRIVSQYGHELLGVSSYWGADLGVNDTLCTAENRAYYAGAHVVPSEADDCVFPLWGAHQILGEPDCAKTYGDCSTSYCPRNKAAETGAVSGTEAPKFPFPYIDWDPSVSLANDGFSEFIEVAFELPVAVMLVEVGEPRGAGSIVKIEAISEDRAVTATLWEGSADPATDAWHDKTKFFSKFDEVAMCQTRFLAKSIRVSMDTSAVGDWNELDYIKLVGSLDFAPGVIPQDVVDVVYTPDPYYFGQDSIKVRGTDSQCASDTDRMGEEVEVTLNVQLTPDVPTLITQAVEFELERNGTQKEVCTSIEAVDHDTVDANDPTGLVYSLMSGSNDNAMFELSHDGNLCVPVNAESLTAGVVHVRICGVEKECGSFTIQAEVVAERGGGGGVAMAVIFGVLGGAAILFAVTLGFVMKNRKLQKEKTAQVLETLKVEKIRNYLTVENTMLKSDVAIMQQYNKEEIAMLEGQIKKFAEDIGTNDEVDKDMAKLLVKADQLIGKVVIGAGAYGEVYKSDYRGTAVAVKTMKQVDEEGLGRFQGEIMLMSGLRHQNVVTMVGCCWEKDLMALVMEFCEKGTSTQVLMAEGPHMTWDDPLLKWLMDVSRGMSYLHGMTYYDADKKEQVKGIIHRDLKPDNCLVTETWGVKIADFGEARAALENATMTQVGTPIYISPEVVKGEYYSDKADVFSFAMTILQFCLKEKPLLEYLKEQFQVYKQKEPNLSRVSHEVVIQGWRPDIEKIEGAPRCVIDLLNMCWEEYPDARPTFPEIVEYAQVEVRNEVMGTGEGDTQGKGSRRTSTSGGLAMRIKFAKGQKDLTKNEKEKEEMTELDIWKSKCAELEAEVQELKEGGAGDGETRAKSKVNKMGI